MVLCATEETAQLTTKATVWLVAMSMCPLGCCILDLSQQCNNGEYGKKLEATGNQSYYFTLKSPYMILAAETYLENVII